MAQREPVGGDLEVESDGTVAARTGVWSTTKKVAVGVTGGAVVAVGVVSMPLPIVPGIPIVLGGLAILSTEFKSVRNKRDELRQRVRSAMQQRR